MKILIFIYECVIFLPIFVISTIVLTLSSIIGCKIGNYEFWSHYPGVVWSKLSLAAALCRVEVEGREKIDPKQSYIFVANHQGSTDIVLIFGYLGQPFRWILRNGIKKVPVLGSFCENSKQIFVDESGANGIIHTVRQAVNVLKSGKSIVIFPEGTRCKDGHLHQFKKGGFAIAAMTKHPVVPVTIVNSFQTMPKGTFIPRPHKMKLIIHDPLPAVTREEGNEAGIHRLLHDSQRAIALDLGEPIQE